MDNSTSQPKSGAPDLDFPDWNGTIDSSQMIGLATAFRHAGQCYKWVRDKDEFNKQRTANIVDVEFIL
jgi:hypothetical protein